LKTNDIILDTLKLLNYYSICNIILVYKKYSQKGGIMKFSLKLSILLIIALFMGAQAQWRAVRVGDTPVVTRPYCVAIGDGRNDGKERVYLSSDVNHIYEWSFYPDSGWRCSDIGEGAYSHHGMISVLVGQGRNDGINRVYCGNANGWIYEFTYSGGQWLKDSLKPSNNGAYMGVQVGDGRNDGVKRVYGFGGFSVQGKEYTFDIPGDSWTRISCSQTHYVWFFDIGKGRNDGLNRIYCTHYQQILNAPSPSTLLECTWNGTTYTENPISSRSAVITRVGEGRNDGINRVYVSATGDHIYEYTYSGGNWEEMDICPGAPYNTRCGLAIGKAQNDGHTRVYSVGLRPYGDIREHTWDGAQWNDTVIDAVTMATTHLALGPGRGDDTMRLYGCDINGVLWEFTHPSPYVQSIEETKSHQLVANAKVSPNPLARNTNIYYSLDKAGTVKIDIYNLSGQIVRNLLNTNHQPGNYQTVWDTRDNFGRALPAGVYLCRMKTSDGFTETKQIVIMK
jgi:hypothetical protein